MEENQSSVLPIPFTETKEETPLPTEPEADENSAESAAEETPVAEKESGTTAESKTVHSDASEPIPSVKTPKRRRTVPLFCSIALCLLAVVSFFFYLTVNADGIRISDLVIHRITTGFLGIDPEADGRDLYQIMMSGSFAQAKETDAEPSAESADDPVNDPSKQSENEKQNGIGESADTETSETKNVTENPDPASLPDGEYAILAADLSAGAVSIINQTGYTMNVELYQNAPVQSEPYQLVIREDMTIEPLVLILHTHGTEGFSAEGSVSYSDTVNVPRSSDITQNIVAVGAVMAETLNRQGIPTLHCEIMHDKESYVNSYTRAAETIRAYLKKYPSIQYVFDVHRDSIVSESKIKYRPITVIDGTTTAQIMTVVGSNYNCPEHTEWERNMTLAVKLHARLLQKYGTLTRSISLRSTSYNQEYAQNSILLEIGSCGNTLAEAKEAGVLVANELASMIHDCW